MAASQRIYDEKDTVDDTLLNQISKYVFYDELSSLARDLEVRETEIRKILRTSSSPQEQTFKVLHTWNNKKFEFKVKYLVEEMRDWQKQGYLDRKIWHSNLFSPSLLSHHSSASSETEHSTRVSPITPKISDQEREAFENEQLDPTIWAPRLCQYFNTEELKLLKEVKRDKTNELLDGAENMTTRGSLKSLLRELKCLYVPLLESENLAELPDNISKRKKYLTLNIAGDDETKFEPLIDQLECTAWKWHRSSKLSYEVLTCLVTLSIFDFSLEDFSFGHILDEKEIDKLSVTLRANFEELKTSKKTSKQALVLNIALNNPFETSKVVQFILQKLPDKISSRFSNCTVHNFDTIQLQKDVTRILTRNDNEKS